MAGLGKTFGRFSKKFVKFIKGGSNVCAKKRHDKKPTEVKNMAKAKKKKK